VENFLVPQTLYIHTVGMEKDFIRIFNLEDQELAVLEFLRKYRVKNKRDFIEWMTEWVEEWNDECISKEDLRKYLSMQ
jgi:hypothetical protein